MSGAAGAGRSRPGSRGARRPTARLIAAGLLAASVAAGCATAGGFRERNRESIERLDVGMTRTEVLDLMGTESVQAAGTEAGAFGISDDTLSVSRVEIPVGGRRPVLQNPHRNEIYEAGGHEWEVLFYYTDLVTDDGLVTDDELTPVVLRDGVVTGWGWSFLAGQVDAYGIPAAVPAFERPRDSLRAPPG